MKHQRGNDNKTWSDRKPLPLEHLGQSRCSASFIQGGEGVLLKEDWGLLTSETGWKNDPGTLSSLLAVTCWSITVEAQGKEGPVPWAGWLRPGWVRLPPLSGSLCTCLTPRSLGSTQVCGTGEVFAVIQSISRVWLFVNAWTAAYQSPRSSTICWSLLKFTSIESLMLSNHLMLCCRLLFWPSVFLNIRVFFTEMALCIRWPKYRSSSFSMSPANEYSALISFRIDWFDLVVPGTLKSLLQQPQFKSINSSALSLIYGPTLTSVPDYWKKNIALTKWVGATDKIPCLLMAVIWFAKSPCSWSSGLKCKMGSCYKSTSGVDCVKDAQRTSLKGKLSYCKAKNHTQQYFSQHSLYTWLLSGMFSCGENPLCSGIYFWNYFVLQSNRLISH